jgi:AhpD family alkylhydroperoxidase
MGAAIVNRHAGIPLVDPDQAPLLARPFYEAGDPGPIVAALAHVPELLEVCVPFLAVVYGPGALPARAKELVVLRTSALLGCRYCVEAHCVVALDTGLSDAEVRSLRGDGAPVAATFADERDGTLLDWVEAVAGGTGAVDPHRLEKLRARYTTPEVVEITTVLGATVMLNRFCTALGLPSSPQTRQRLAEAGLA